MGIIDRMVKRSILVMSMFIAGGCGPHGEAPSAYQLRLDPDMTPDQTTVVLNAYSDWEVEAGVHTIPVVSAEPCPMQLDGHTGCIQVHYGTVADATAMCGGAMAGYVRGGCTRTTSVDGYAWKAEMVLTWRGEYTIDHEVAAHEAGHAFGLHHDIPGTLMAPSTDQGYPDITERDIAQFHRVQGF